MKKWLIGAALACGPLLSTPEAQASEFASLRVSLLANDDDLTSSGFASVLHLGLRLRSPELGPGLRAEAEVSLLLSSSNSGDLSFRDNASFLRLVWRPESWGETEGLSLTVLPLTSTRLHLGYEQPATWGRGVYAVSSSRSGIVGAPGLEARLTREHGYAFTAAKSVVGINSQTGEPERLAMVMAGAGVDVWPLVRLEAAGAFVQHGVIESLANLGREERASTGAVSGRVLFHQGAPIGPSVDFSLYQQDPEVFEKLFAPEEYPGGVSASVSLEATALSQTLMDPDVDEGAVRSQGAEAVALQARLKVDFLRVHALALHRSATFISSEVPGFPPFKAYPQDTGLRSELLLSAGADYHFAGPALTPGLVVRAVWPAAFDNTRLVGIPDAMPRFVLLRGPAEFTALRPGRERQPILLAKATLRWDFGSAFSAMGEAFYTQDPNRGVNEDDDTGTPASTLGFSALLQARF
ncbi:hypothetical protein ATI61_12627 [Archangium gephyra]|uniref:Uncharacterized protein n=1 Tax=Archangium gephyra TaxID=48 RepID=A0ABX9JKJ0_9BACT|nr:hypothetical protein [Archangium gephyra]REG15351.1 hypothetical protein ATI61_12627 [Archangium gephyra]